MIRRVVLETDAEMIGFVFPIYDFKPPKIVKEFIGRISNIKSKYLFAVCTYGIAPSNSLNYLDKILESSGGKLSAGFAVNMPYNGIGSAIITDRAKKNMYNNWNKKLEQIYDYVDSKKEGKIEASIIFFDFFKVRFIKMLPILIKFLVIMLFKGVDSFAFTVSKKCNGCSICKRICPVDNIKMVDNKPQWSDHCISCFACLHWCPKEAISLGGYNLNIANYHHPDVKIADMLE